MNKNTKSSDMGENCIEKGNAMVFVLIAIMLFVALIVTFTKGSQRGKSSLTEQSAKIYAGEIIEYANLVERAVNRVRSRNFCSENEINFDNSTVSGYTNTNAPSDDSCDIFDSSGGQVSYTAPQDSWLVSSYSAQSSYGEWVFSGSNYSPGVGTDASSSGNDLVMIVMYLDKQICLEINKRLGVTNTGGNPPAEGSDISIAKFTGSFPASPTDLWDTNTGTTSACLGAAGTTPAADSYFFFYSLIIR